MARDKLLAEWFWIDRWDGSSAALLPLEARGLYREMLSQAWRRGARLPNSPMEIQRAVRCTSREWKRSWPKVQKFWVSDGNGNLVNETQQEIYAEAQAIREKASNRARAGAQARHKHCSSSAQAQLEHMPPSPSPSPSPTNNGERQHIPEASPRATTRDPNAGWSKEACDDWIAAYEGTAPGGPIGRHLKLLVTKHTWEKVRPAWRAYLAETEAQYANPARFAATYGTWKTEPAPPKPAPEPLPPLDLVARAFFDAMKLRLSGILSREAIATWFRPTYAQAWEGETLVLVVPSKQFAEQMRFYAPKLRDAAAELDRHDVKFRTIVSGEGLDGGGE